jgi:hypothetical protein
MRVGLTVFGSRENTLKSYQAALAAFLAEFTDRQIGEISTEEVLSFYRMDSGILVERLFLTKLKNAERCAYRTRLVWGFLPSVTRAMKRLFRNRAPARWNTIDKEAGSGSEPLNLDQGLPTVILIKNGLPPLAVGDKPFQQISDQVT